MWKFAPQIIQRSPLRFLCPFLHQMEVRRRLQDEMFVFIYETVTVEQIGPLPSGDLPQAIM